MTCTTCGNANADGARFCNNCGATLSPAQIPAGVGSLAASGQVVATIEPEKKDELIGLTIEGRYRIDSLIGLGGMGSVYRVARLLIGDEVAMKILHTERVTDPRAGERFRREAQAAARLKHPNAVSIYDFGITSDGLQYLVMELLEGLSLRQIIKQEGSLAPSVAAEITTQVCAALDEAHQRHIVHRDIKPDNIIINSTITGLRVKVLDFGIAKLRDDVASHLTQTGSVMGTPHYMSPEQCLGEELDSRADIYSMGIVLYEMLCGRVPFNSPVSTAVVVQHVNQPPPSLRTINTGISPQVEAVVFHALEKRRDARPATASALARELTAAVHSASVHAHSHSTWSQMSGPLQPPTHVTEETVMRRGARTPAASEMPATVHLRAAQASGPTPSVRSTVPSGRLGVTRTNQKLLLTIGAAALGVVLLGAVVAIIAWSLRKPNDVVGDKSATNPTPPTGMAYVPGNEFVMGNDAGDESERPQHKVTVKPFFIDIYEVTCEEYEKFIRATSRQPPATWANGHHPNGWERRPVTGIDWDDASAYANWAGKRLPTEDEWESASRGTDGRRYPWGNEWSKGLANADNPRGGLSNVGSFKGASPYGLFDMVGNAWEWTASDFVAYPGGRLTGQATGHLKVIRGGTFLSRPNQATTTIRVGWPARGGDEYDNTGFRCAKDLPAGTQSGDASAPTLTVDLGNNVNLELVLITAGNFQMGRDKDDSEAPVHRVTISQPFYLGKYEVTQAQWQAVMGNNPSYFKKCGGNCPVEQVTWDDVMEFITRVNAKGDGQTYRLPTEAEWEYAARAGTTGDYAGNLDEMAWYDQNSGSKTHPVGQKMPNAWDLYDMHGNVNEWCQDNWHGNYNGAPNDGSVWSGGVADSRVLRGGAWNGYSFICRASFRHSSLPGFRFNGFGFRVVVSVRTQSVEAPNVVVTPPTDNKTAAHSDFQTFWSDFKKAIKEGDKDAVVEMTNIPFKDQYREELSKYVQGLGQPRTSYSVDDFKTNYNRIFTPQIVNLINSNRYIGWKSRSELGNSSDKLKKGDYLLLTESDEGEVLLFGKKDGVYKLLGIPPHYDMTLDGL